MKGTRPGAFAIRRGKVLLTVLLAKTEREAVEAADRHGFNRWGRVTAAEVPLGERRPTVP